MAWLLRRFFGNAARVAEVSEQAPPAREHVGLARPDPDEAFSAGLLRTANRLRGEVGLEATGEIDTAVSFVLTSAVVGALQEAGQRPGAPFVDMDDAALGAAFLCVACVPVIYHLEQEGYQLSLNEVMASVGFTVYEQYSEDAAVRIVHAGLRKFREVVQATKDYANMKEWNDDVAMVIWAYAKTGDEQYIPMLSKLYRSLHQATRGA